VISIQCFSNSFDTKIQFDSGTSYRKDIHVSLTSHKMGALVLVNYLSSNNYLVHMLLRHVLILVVGCKYKLLLLIFTMIFCV